MVNKSTVRPNATFVHTGLESPDDLQSAVFAFWRNHMRRRELDAAVGLGSKLGPEWLAFRAGWDAAKADGMDGAKPSAPWYRNRVRCMTTEALSIELSVTVDQNRYAEIASELRSRNA